MATSRIDLDVDRAIGGSWEPYEHFLSGLRMRDAGMYESAIVEFRLGFDSIVQVGQKSHNEARIVAFLEAYLDCLTSCQNPNAYRADFERCTELFRQHLVSETSTTLADEGWYHLLVYEVNDAISCFTRAVNQANFEKSNLRLASAERGLAYAYLCLGDAEHAHQYADSAMSTDAGFPFYCPPAESAVREQLLLYGPPYEKALRALIGRLENEQPNRRSPGEFVGEYVPPPPSSSSSSSGFIEEKDGNRVDPAARPENRTDAPEK
jgi:tetratricopeptide (TPR) repeat protein